VLCALDEAEGAKPLTFEQLQKQVGLCPVALHAAIDSLRPLLLVSRNKSGPKEEGNEQDKPSCIAFNFKWLQKSRRRMNLAWREEKNRIRCAPIIPAPDTQGRPRGENVDEKNDPYNTQLSCPRRNYFDVTLLRVAAIRSWDLSPSYPSRCELCRQDLIDECTIIPPSESAEFPKPSVVTSSIFIASLPGRRNVELQKLHPCALLIYLSGQVLIGI